MLATLCLISSGFVSTKWLFCSQLVVWVFPPVPPGERVEDIVGQRVQVASVGEVSLGRVTTGYGH